MTYDIYLGGRKLPFITFRGGFYMSKKENSVNQITEGVIWKQLLIFFFPIMLGTLF